VGSQPHLKACWLKLDDVPRQEGKILYSLLSVEDQTRADLFRQPCKRKEFIAAHALVRGLLSSRTGIPPQAWRFHAEPGGRLNVENHSGAPHFVVSLSHTRGLAMAAIAEGCAVGVDAEWLGRKYPQDRERTGRVQALPLGKK